MREEKEQGTSAAPMISIIVPVYNTEKYLHRCIDSVLAQTYKDFELLLIDDGSKDGSGAICDEYAAKDGRIKVFHKENGGVSTARNLGLDNAKGEWITFVDSDDYIEENFLKSFEGNLDADLVVGNMFEKGPHGNLLRNTPSGYHYSLKEVLKGNLTKLAFQSTWGKLFRKSLLDGVRFDERMIIGEDHYFVLKYAGVSRNIRILERKEFDNVDSSHYIYLPSPNMSKKYQISVQSSVYHTKKLEEVYLSLGIKDKFFEMFLPCAYYEHCMDDLSTSASQWYGNQFIRRICLRRSAHFGFFSWIRSWLVFHGLYRLRKYSIKENGR